MPPSFEDLESPIEAFRVEILIGLDVGGLGAAVTVITVSVAASISRRIVPERLTEINGALIGHQARRGTESATQDDTRKGATDNQTGDAANAGTDACTADATILVGGTTACKRCRDSENQDQALYIALLTKSSAI